MTILAQKGGIDKQLRLIYTNLCHPEFISGSLFFKLDAETSSA
jgi:hypothetical protein